MGCGPAPCPRSCPVPVPPPLQDVHRDRHAAGEGRSCRPVAGGRSAAVNAYSPLSALDRPLRFTVFDSAAADDKVERPISLRNMAELIRRTTAPRKAALPWLKVARFGELRTDNDSLRHNANVLGVDGI